jgi:hypothetical protein
MNENRSSLVIIGDSGSLGQITKKHLKANGFELMDIPSLRSQEFIDFRLPLRGEKIVINASGSTPSSSTNELKSFVSANLAPLQKIQEFLIANEVDCFIHFSSWLTSTNSHDEYTESKRLAEKFVVENIMPNVRECYILPLPTIWSGESKTNSRLHELLAKGNYKDFDQDLLINGNEVIKIMSSLDFETFLTRVLLERRIPEMSEYVFHGTVMSFIQLLRSKTNNEKKAIENIRITLGG